jgi:hypothetical protein
MNPVEKHSTFRAALKRSEGGNIQRPTPNERCVAVAMKRVGEFGGTPFAVPSPLKGERVRVRGQSTADGPFAGKTLTSPRPSPLPCRERRGRIIRRLTTNRTQNIVAQIFNLPYRRVALGKARDGSSDFENVNGLRIANPRYSRVQLGATTEP